MNLRSCFSFAEANEAIASVRVEINKGLDDLNTQKDDAVSFCRVCPELIIILLAKPTPYIF